MSSRSRLESGGRAAALCATILTSSAALAAHTCLDNGTPYVTTKATSDDAPFAVVACDLNGDGHLDLATANDASDTISVLVSDGMGGFGAPHRGAVGPAGTRFEPVDIACCDLDGDQRLDLITANRSSDNISILYNTGNLHGVPQFASPVNHAVGQAPWAVRCAPINPDAHPDIVTANFTSNSVSVLINDGSGGVNPAASYAVSVGSAPRSLALCDIDGDADLDLLTANLSGKSVTVLRNDGAAGLIGGTALALNVNPFGIACCDIDGIQGPDIVTANIVDDSIVLLFNNGAGVFGGRTRLGGSDGANNVACADLDHDGLFEIVTANISANNISVYPNLGGVLGAPLYLATALNPTDVIVGPFLSSGPDLAVASAEGLRIFQNQCAAGCQVDLDCPDDGLFCNGQEYCDPTIGCTSTGTPCSGATSFCWEDSGSCGLPGDFDRDGDLDLHDFSAFTRCFGQSPAQPACAPAELDGAAPVDAADFLLFLAAFLGPAAPP